MFSEGRPTSLRLYSLLAVMVVMFSANYAVGKHVLTAVPPLLLIGLRSVISAAAVLTIYHSRNSSRDWSNADFWPLVGLGLAGVAFNQIFFMLGLAQTTVSHAAIMIGLTPVLVLTMAALSGQERLSVGRLCGMLVALIGVWVLQKEDGTRRSSVLGDVLVLMAAVSFAFYTVKGKVRLRKLSSVTINTFAYCTTAVLVSPVTVWTGLRFDFAAPPMSVWLGLLYMALLPSGFGYMIYSWALQYIPASKISTLAYFQPLLAILISAVTLAEYPGANVLFGGSLVLIGVFATERL